MGPIAMAISAVAGFSSFGSFILNFVGSIVMSAITKLLFAPANAFTPQPRTIMVREPARAWNIVYGRARTSGVVVFIHSSSSSVSKASDPDDEGTKVLHLIVALAAHKCHSLEQVYINDEEVVVNSDGTVTGKYADHLYVYPHLGDADQATDPVLAEWLPHLWTEDHRLRGRTYLYVQLWYDDQLYPSLPRISAVLKGKEVYDVRDATTRWSNNPILCIRDFLTEPQRSYGIGASSAVLNDTVHIAQANICDERVAVIEGGAECRIGDYSPFTAYTSLSFSHERRGDTVKGKTVLSAVKIHEGFVVNTGDAVILTGTMPAPLVAGTRYYWIAQSGNVITNDNFESEGGRWAFVGQLATSQANALAGTYITLTTGGSGEISGLKDIVIEGEGMDRLVDGDEIAFTTTGSLFAPAVVSTPYYWIRGRDNAHGRIASSYDNAIAGTAIAFTSLGSGVHSIKRGTESRFTCDGVFSTDIKRDETLATLLGSCAGYVAETGGYWSIYAGAFTASVKTLTQDDARGPVRITPLISRRDLFNSVKGTYWSPINFDQPASFPAVSIPEFVTEDGSEIWQDVSLPFTQSPSMAQRIGMILLRRVREQVTVHWPATLKAGLALEVGDTVTLNVSRYGFSGVTYTVEEWELVQDIVGERAAAVGVNLVLRETGASVYAWSVDDEKVPPTIPNTNLPSPFVPPSAPGAPSVVEQLYESQTGAGLKTRLDVSWTASTRGYIASYQLQHRASGATDWTTEPSISGLFHQTAIFDVPSGARQFRVRAISTRGYPSDWSTVASYTVQGLTAIPADLTGFAVVPMGGSGHATWNAATDLDVKIGGEVIFKWSPLTAGATAIAAQELYTNTPGAATEATLPLRSGTYFAKFKDSSGNKSANWAVFVTTLPSLLVYDAVIVQDEHTSWGGTLDGLVIDTGAVQLDTGSFDDVVDVDALPNWDTAGGLNTEGTYTADVIDLGAVYPVRVLVSIESTPIGLGITIDERAEPIDDWEDFDGDDAGDDAPVSARVFARITNDNPGGSPTWSDWFPITAADLVFRAIELQLRVSTTDQAVNLSVTAMTTTIDVPERTEIVKDLSSSVSGSTITYANAFYAKPAIAVSIKNAQQGDYWVATSEGVTGFTLTVYNASNAAVARTCDVHATGFGFKLA